MMGFGLRPQPILVSARQSGCVEEDRRTGLRPGAGDGQDQACERRGGAERWDPARMPKCTKRLGESAFGELRTLARKRRSAAPTRMTQHGPLNSGAPLLTYSGSLTLYQDAEGPPCTIK